MGSSNACWYIPDKVVFVHNVGDLTGDDFRHVDKQIIDLMQSAEEKGVEKIHVIVDSIEMGKLPSIRDLEGGRILKYMKESACGWTVVVGYDNNPFLSVLSRLLTSVMHVDLYMARTLTMGTNTLKQVDPSLSNMPDIEAWKLENLSVQNSN